ncbi:MAG: NAD-dependent epimerase/dehydratase [Gammaproteobacteria bacterium]|nr:NAD-dependent epimerase/dehydratase [Gammaproteobacteria bacterium]
MKILLTGASGFLGNRLLHDFIAKKHQVIITKRAHSDMTPFSTHTHKFEAWNIDDFDLADIFQAHPDIEAIIHAATDYGHHATMPTRTFWSNEAFPIRLMTLAIEYHVPLFINMDTFFNTGTEDYNYLRSYTLSKRHFQEWGKYCAELKKLAFINLKLFHLYGPNDNPNKFMPSVIKRCLAGEHIDLTSGEQKRDFIYLDDVVQAISLILSNTFDAGYHHYDIGSGHSCSIRSVVETVNGLCNNSATLNFGALPTRTNELDDACANPAAIKTLGWKPLITLREGLISIIKEIETKVACIE